MKINMYSDDELLKIEQNKKEENEFRKLLSKLLSGDEYVSSKPLFVGITPYAIDCCINNKGLELFVSKSVITKCMRAEIRDKSGKQTKRSGHGLTKQQINDIVWAIKRPIMIIKGSQPYTVAIMTDLKDKHNRYIFAFVALNIVGATASINTISSAYGRNKLEDYLKKCIENDMIMAVNIEKVDEIRLSIRGHFSEATVPINFDNTIAYSLKSVKRN